jgi:hypothetical protein
MSDGGGARRIYGSILIACALLAVLGMLHHPVLPRHDPSEIVQAFAGVSGPSVAIHSFLIAVVLVQLIGFHGFARTLGFGRPLVAGGFILWTAGTLALISAAVINGLALPSLAAAFHDATPAQAETFRSLARFAWSLNQAWDKVGLVSWCAALILWSAALVRLAGPARLLGAIGLIAPLGLATAVLTGALAMGAHGFTLAIACFSLWTLAAGALLLAGRAGPAAQPDAKAG